MKKWIVIIGAVIAILVVVILLYNTPEKQGKREARKIEATTESLANDAILANVENNFKQAGLTLSEKERQAIRNGK